MNVKYDACRLHQESAHTQYPARVWIHTAAMPSIVLALYEAKALALANCTYKSLGHTDKSLNALTNKVKIVLNKVVLE